MTSEPRGSPRFATTRWSVVAAAGAADPAAREALESLCGTYWYPLYAFARRRGDDRERAADLVQGFFAELLSRGWVEDADASRGRFRSFLLTAFRRFRGHERAKDVAAKRGGGRVVAIDFDAAESRLAAEAGPETDPERAFERRWALTLLARALDRTRSEFETSGKAELFDALGPFIGGGGREAPYAEIAARLDSTEGAVKVAVHRLRARYRENVRAEILDTVADEAHVEDEIRRLMDAVAR